MDVNVIGQILKTYRAWGAPDWLAAALAAAALAACALLLGRASRRPQASAPQEAPSEEARGAREIPAVGYVYEKGMRDLQQDAFAISPLRDREAVEARGVLAVLADGMGGLSDGDQVSGMVVSCMMERFPQVRESGAQALLELISQVNEAVNRRFGGGPQCGSTLVAALVRDGLLYFASIGDSEICLVRGGGLICLNRRHVYGAQLDEEAARGFLSPRDAREHAMRHAVTSFVGMGVLKQVDWIPDPIRLEPGDKILLMSDGVFHALDDGQIARALCGDAAQGAERLRREIEELALPSQDNYTAVVLEV